MAQKFVNNFSSAVAQTFGIADTYLYITTGDGAKLPALGAGDFLLLTLYRLSGVQESGHEVVKVTSITGDMLTVARAHEGAAASQFAIGDRVALRLTSRTISGFCALSSSATYTYNADGTVATTSEATEIGPRSTTYTYNADGTVNTVVSVLAGTTRTTTYTYNADGTVNNIITT